MGTQSCRQMEASTEPEGKKKPKQNKGKSKEGSEAVNEEASAAEELEAFIIFQASAFFSLYLSLAEGTALSTPSCHSGLSPLLGAKNGPIKHQRVKHSLGLIQHSKTCAYMGRGRERNE